MIGLELEQFLMNLGWIFYIGSGCLVFGNFGVFTPVLLHLKGDKKHREREMLKIVKFEHEKNLLYKCRCRNTVSFLSDDVRLFFAWDVCVNVSSYLYRFISTHFSLIKHNIALTELKWKINFVRVCVGETRNTRLKIGFL